MSSGAHPAGIYDDKNTRGTPFAVTPAGWVNTAIIAFSSMMFLFLFFGWPDLCPDGLDRCNGNWFDTANWSAGVPDLTTDGQINNGGTAQIDSAELRARKVWGWVSTVRFREFVYEPRKFPDHECNGCGHQGTGRLNIANASLLDLFGIVGNRAGSIGAVTVGRAPLHVDQSGAARGGREWQWHSPDSLMAAQSRLRSLSL